MSFTDDQIKLLMQPLDSAVVRNRTQGGGKVDYIDGYHAISEANRIFGFDGWSYTVKSLTNIQNEERANAKGIKNWNAGYIATVELRVGETTREDVGAGNGIDNNPYQAHESAVKEAITDGLKRCLRTFGNTFGLALYDKDRKNVGKRTKAQEDLSSEMESSKDRINRASTYFALLGWDQITKQDQTKKLKDLAKSKNTDWVDELEMACKELGLL